MSASQSNAKTPAPRRKVALDIYLAVARGLPEPKNISLHTYTDGTGPIASLLFDSRAAATRWAEHLHIVETGLRYADHDLHYHTAALLDQERPEWLGWRWAISGTGGPEPTPKPDAAREIESALTLTAQAALTPDTDTLPAVAE